MPANPKRIKKTVKPLGEDIPLPGDEVPAYGAEWPRGKDATQEAVEAGLMTDRRWSYHIVDPDPELFKILTGVDSYWIDAPIVTGEGLDVSDKPFVNMADVILPKVIRRVSSTGGAKEEKLARFDQIPTYPLWALAEHYGAGNAKYPSHDGDNWRKGYDWSLSYAALQRHATAFWAGQDIDEETGHSHLVAVAWHAFTLLEFTRTKPGFDDRQNWDQT